MKDQVFISLPVCISFCYLIYESKCQFHQHFMSAFFVRNFVQSKTLSKEKTFECKIRALNVDEIDRA